jgi:hypothetical protein
MLPSIRPVLHEASRVRLLRAHTGRDQCFAAAHAHRALHPGRLDSAASVAANLRSQEWRCVLALRKGLDAGCWERWASLLQARHMHEHGGHRNRCV